MNSSRFKIMWSLTKEIQVGAQRLDALLSFRLTKFLIPTAALRAQSTTA